MTDTIRSSILSGESGLYLPSRLSAGMAGIKGTRWNFTLRLARKINSVVIGIKKRKLPASRQAGFLSFTKPGKTSTTLPTHHSMNTAHFHKFVFQSSSEFADQLLALLSALPFEAFEEKEDVLEAWLPQGADSTVVEMELKLLQSQLPFLWTTEEVAPQNWNALWEASFQPVSVGDFCHIRADFHPPQAHFAHEIIIHPKMAFGTAHHETTYMMIEQMESLPLKGASVLDLGCGTGILAILAAKMGAVEVVAIDIDEQAVENTLENLVKNDLQGVTARQGTLQSLHHPPFDVILANINRKVILDGLSALNYQLKTGGTLLLSGILRSDEATVVKAAGSYHFKPTAQRQKNGWICVSMIKEQPS